MRKRGLILKVAIVGLFTVACISIFVSGTEKSVAKSDDIIAEIAEYKSWRTISKAAYEVLSVLTGEDLTLRNREPAPMNFEIQGPFG